MPAMGSKSDTDLCTGGPRFKFERLIVSEPSGVALQFKEHDGRRFIVKTSAPDQQRAMKKEIELLEQLKGAEHIVSPILSSRNPLVPGKDERHGLDVPFVIMQCLENGTLEQFRYRIHKHKGRYSIGYIPNRILWAIFLCKIRACMAMAYPQSASPGKPEKPDERTPDSIAHLNMHAGNFVFDQPEPGEGEHSTVPPLKLLGFGFARRLGHNIWPTRGPPTMRPHTFDVVMDLFTDESERGKRNCGMDQNLLDVGVQMVCLITQFSYPSVSHVREVTMDEFYFRFPPHLDPELKRLVQRCLAGEPYNRPRLEELAGLIDSGVFSKTANDYADTPNRYYESDQNIRDFVQRYILDAETAPLPLLGA
ncbi:Uu.00g004220.m01.CDS01 [Anthostomella pinea]|uniref:Uu.00g004220.m01.CDS01 n=1 Tax=Anthostomella pinea TaxID=933095 RepID=A0AAI8VKI3_9PEZI|nr:Uu.00g004220.m01.CDS01 [Anthostomella pinea]